MAWYLDIVGVRLEAPEGGVSTSDELKPSPNRERGQQRPQPWPGEEKRPTNAGLMTCQNPQSA